MTLMAMRVSQLRLLGKSQLPIEVAYEPIGIRVSRLAFGRPKATIYHFHEILFGNGRRHERQAIAALRHADLVTVADSGRADLMLAVEPCIAALKTIRNLPLASAALRSPPIRTEEFSAVYFGSRSHAQNLDRIVSSMDRWPAKVRLHLYGRKNPTFDEELRRIAAERGVLDRLVFEGWVHMQDLIRTVARHHLGFAMLRPLNDNWKFSAGASNKKYQLMAAGVPQIADNGRGTPEVVHNRGVGTCVSPDDEDAIAAAVHAYFNSPIKVETEGRSGRELIMTELNQECEFSSVLSFFEIHGS
ncbi:glycosyltransferase [Posidoniimonas polymericola]|nr:glycosyltransferase [Posidoniimonas polymericola]